MWLSTKQTRNRIKNLEKSNEKAHKRISNLFNDLQKNKGRIKDIEAKKVSRTENKKLTKEIAILFGKLAPIAFYP